MRLEQGICWRVGRRSSARISEIYCGDQTTLLCSRFTDHLTYWLTDLIDWLGWLGLGLVWFDFIWFSLIWFDLIGLIGLIDWLIDWLDCVMRKWSGRWRNRHQRDESLRSRSNCWRRMLGPNRQQSEHCVNSLKTSRQSTKISATKSGYERVLVNGIWMSFICIECCSRDIIIVVIVVIIIYFYFFLSVCGFFCHFAVILAILMLCWCKWLLFVDDREMSRLDDSNESLCL